MHGKPRVLSPEFLERRWKPGQSGNPSGQTADYGEVVRLARSRSVRAIERLGELMESEDERVAAVACNAILDRAFGKPRPLPVEQDITLERLRAMTPEERERDAYELYERARRVLLEDDRRQQQEAEGIEDASPEPAGRMTEGGADMVEQ